MLLLLMSSQIGIVAHGFATLRAKNFVIVVQIFQMNVSMMKHHVELFVASIITFIAFVIFQSLVNSLDVKRNVSSVFELLVAD